MQVFNEKLQLQLPIAYLHRTFEHALYVHKLSNMADMKALAEEFAGLLGDEATFIEIYKRATAEKFGFLYITMGSDPKFFSSYKSEFRLKDREEEK